MVSGISVKKIGSITVLGKLFKIYEKQFTDEDAAVGWTDYEKSSISIQSGVNADVRESILIHEVLHIISDCMGMDLTENQILQLESGLSGIIKVKYKKS